MLEVLKADRDMTVLGCIVSPVDLYRHIQLGFPDQPAMLYYVPPFTMNNTSEAPSHVAIISVVRWNLGSILIILSITLLM